MSFIIGPRQCGKTTLVRDYLADRDAAANYFNWDDLRVQRAFRENPYWFEAAQKPKERVPIAFDEIHKMRRWKNFLKGAYDAFASHFFFVLTGSGRLDLFQRGGDSLAGRYDPYRLFPLTPGEIERKQPASAIHPANLLAATPIPDATLQTWGNLGGFPEPFLAGSAQKATRWWDQYQLRVTSEDLRELTALQSTDLSRHILMLLPGRVGSPLSLNSIREEVGAAHATVDRYVRSLQQVFLCFEVPPYSRKLARAVKKEKKLYFYHHPAVGDPGARFENMIASLLLKWCASVNERALGRPQLFYLRDQDRREVDFLLTEDGQPQLLIEAKRQDTQFSSGLLYYANKLKIPVAQIVSTPGVAIRRKEGAVVSIHRLAALTG